MIYCPHSIANIASCTPIGLALIIFLLTALLRTMDNFCLKFRGVQTPKTYPLLVTALLETKTETEILASRSKSRPNFWCPRLI